MSFFLALLLSPWTWRLVFENALIGIFVVVVSFLFYKKQKWLDGKILLSLLVILLVVQYKTTDKQPLSALGDSQKFVQQQRLHIYPPTFYQVFGHYIWFYPANWFEESRFSIWVNRIQQNFSEVVDPGLYFFANHPRQRVGFDEFEKFPYVFLPFFVFGILKLERRFCWQKGLFVLLPIFLVSFVGHRNQYGPIGLFPFIVVVCATGMNAFVKRFAGRQSLKVLLLVFLSLVFLQVMSYEYS